MPTSFSQIKKILNNGTSAEKISILSELIETDTNEIVSEIIKMLDDTQIQVRGEAFSTLVLNPNDISKTLIYHLTSESKNIRGFSILVLANRNDITASAEIAKLTTDESSMVRSCALGGLGHLNAKEFSKNIHDCFSDSNIEVKRSALFAAMCISDKISLEEISKLKEENDSEIEKILNRRNNSI